MGLQVASEARRSILVDVLTVHGQGGKSIVFCERKRDADEVAAGVALSMPCEVGELLACRSAPALVHDRMFQPKSMPLLQCELHYSLSRSMLLGPA